MAIEGANLRYSFHSVARDDYQFEVPLSGIRPAFDEYRQVAWSWFLLVSLLTAACMTTSDVCAGELEALVVQVPDPKELFRAEDLTAQQVSLCAQFRQSAGEFRKPAFDALWQAGALPIDQKRVSPAQIVALLGAPDRREKDRMIFSLGFSGGRGYSLDIVLVDGRAAMIGFSTTL